MESIQIREQLSRHGMKITPQRLAVVEALYALKSHPTVEEVARKVHTTQPNIATGTIYNILEALVNKGLVAKVKTESDVMRYDIFLDPHHHLYCSDCSQIEDYYNPELTALLERYFEEHSIPGFTIDAVRLQINGRFENPSMHRMRKTNEQMDNKQTEF